MKKRDNKLKSFTLVELMLTVVIISILSGLVLMVINPGILRAKARDTNRKKDLVVISEGLGQYYADNNRYPNTGIAAAATALSPASGTIYMKVFPTQNDYCYVSTDAGHQNYVACTYLESLSSEIPTGVTACNPAGAGSFAKRFCVTNPF